MTYADKLKDPRWQRKRLQIFERDNWRCLECTNESKQLQIHHIVYLKRDPWDYPDHLLQTFCEPCHKERQELTDKIVNAVKMAIAPVPTVRLIPTALEICSQAMLRIEVDK
jgi:5-methylcytosine-specific restriction endonuclease McrA